MQYFKFVNWRIGEFVVSFFGVTNRLKVTESPLIPSGKESSNILEGPNITNVMEVLFEIKREIITKDQFIKVAKSQEAFSFSSCFRKKYKNNVPINFLKEI